MEEPSREINVELDKTCKCALAAGKEWLPDFPQWHLIRWVSLWASPCQTPSPNTLLLICNLKEEA